MTPDLLTKTWARPACENCGHSDMAHTSQQWGRCSGSGCSCEMFEGESLLFVKRTPADAG